MTKETESADHVPAQRHGTRLLAHSLNTHGDWHALSDHLAQVADLADSFAQAWGDPFWARLAGAWHDIGKARPGFQSHVRRDPDAHIEARVPGADKTHSAAGALHARSEFVRLLGSPAAAELARPLEYLIAGHHAGLADWQPITAYGGLAARLAAAQARVEYDEARLALSDLGVTTMAAPDAAVLLGEARRWKHEPLPLGRALGLRMLFSALVDADFLDTEAHFDAGKAQRRGAFPPIAHYAERLAAHLARMQAHVSASAHASSPVMQAREAVLAACRSKAALPPGVFTLTVPTGGGKTLSSLAFALEHARQHGLRRVVYAIPYTSIIEQTASVFADVFGADNIIEHPSQAQPRDDGETTASRLATENWDAPLIVTTNVQLFESLFAHKPSRCRKLHRLAGSVIVLDEAQTLPPAFLQPILDALNVLLARYRISLVLCTATQPVLSNLASIDPRKELRGLPPPQPIIDAPQPLYDRLRRTRIHWPDDLKTTVELSEIAARVQSESCALAVVNTRQDAMDLSRLLPRETTLHLSAAMCGAHRADVLAELRRRLTETRGDPGKTLYVVSTQLIEAGVDVDFPVVFRALAGLDSIAQAAGRCNREGLQTEPGRVHVFVRPIPGKLPLLRSAAECTISLRAEGLDDALAPAAYERYFPLFYMRQHTCDVHDIVELLRDREGDFQFGFRSAAERFKLIDDAGQEALLIPMDKIAPGHDHIAPLAQRLANGDTDRWLLRKLQRYVLNVHAHVFKKLQRDGAVAELPGGWYRLTDVTRYDPRFGLLPEHTPLDAVTMVQ